jgi:hypothetical protein
VLLPSPVAAAQDVQAAFGLNERPAVNTAQHGGPVGLPTFVYAYNGVVFEVLRNGRLASVTLFEPQQRRGAQRAH